MHYCRERSVRRRVPCRDLGDVIYSNRRRPHAVLRAGTTLSALQPIDEVELAMRTMALRGGLHIGLCGVLLDEAVTV
jgi:hypothetical protein